MSNTMSLIDITPNTIPEDQARADGFLLEANAKFEALRTDVYDAVRRFWYADLPDEDDEGKATPPRDEKDLRGGIKALQAMGNNAKPFMDIAYARVSMLYGVASALGKADEIDLTKAASPYTLTYDDNGALDTWKLN